MAILLGNDDYLPIRPSLYSNKVDHMPPDVCVDYLSRALSGWDDGGDPVSSEDLEWILSAPSRMIINVDLNLPPGCAAVEMTWSEMMERLNGSSGSAPSSQSSQPSRSSLAGPANEDSPIAMPSLESRGGRSELLNSVPESSSLASRQKRPLNEESQCLYSPSKRPTSQRSTRLRMRSGISKHERIPSLNISRTRIKMSRRRTRKYKHDRKDPIGRALEAFH
ncbi:hypothetical protein ABW21_db0206203 [Orbilia brochopaga]|nr:hypothetical protein ABW21_db0206203 [Drechslerella brochopaga]